MSTPPDHLPKVVERFLRYVRIDTQADPRSETVPSTAKQLDLSRLLKEELDVLGVEAHLDEHGYVHAALPSRGGGNAPRLGLVAHVDTSPDEPGGPVKPVVHPPYDGGIIAFAGNPSISLDPAKQPALRDHLGHNLITSDGTTLLGSDDKAGVAIIMQLVEDLLQSNIPHPELRILFTVDEEVGQGVDHLDLERFGADVAYTIDGGGCGEISHETFHALDAVITIDGVNVHPGYAHGAMVNAARIAAELVSVFPTDEAPETTREREGYIHPHRIMAEDPGRAIVEVLLRDFADDGIERRTQWLTHVVDDLRQRHPRATISLEIEERYRNMREHIERVDPRTVTIALEAGDDIGLDITTKPVRGGTDGARLSELGIPTPNLFTGGHDFHSLFEWNSVQNLELSLTYLKAVVRRWSET